MGEREKERKRDIERESRRSEEINKGEIGARTDRDDRVKLRKNQNGRG